jgi:TRAP-type uncharacterized transport system fused permease subunit
VAAPPLDDEDEPSRRLGGALVAAVTALCCALALFAVKQVFRPAGNGIQYYLSLFLAGALPLTFLLVPARRRIPELRRRDRPSALVGRSRAYDPARGPRFTRAGSSAPHTCHAPDSSPPWPRDG